MKSCNLASGMDQYVRFSEMHGKCIQALDIMSPHGSEDAAENAADVLQFNGAITLKLHHL